jgi:hypothetical protein
MAAKDFKVQVVALSRDYSSYTSRFSRSILSNILL